MKSITKNFYFWSKSWIFFIKFTGISFILRLQSGIRTKIIIGGTFMFNNLKRKFLVIATIIGSLSMFSIPQNVSAGAHEQYFPIASSRVGPYSAMGTG